MKYLEIYPSEVAGKKIAEHLDKMLKNPPKVYRKTLKRYEKLAILLLDCVDKINRLLQQEALLSSGTSEFDELSTDDSAEIEAKLQQIQANSHETSEFLKKNIDLPDTTSSKSNKQTIAQYAEVFREGSTLHFGYAEVDDCAKLMNEWYTARFVPKLKNPNFKYQITQLPVWSAYIVLAYGKHHAEGNLSAFKQRFNNWIQSVQTDMNNCWALPSEVYSLIKNISPQDCTLDAVAIYDILMEKCYYKLTESNVAIKMDPNLIAMLVKSNSKELSDPISMRFINPEVLITQAELFCYETTMEGGY